MKLTFVGTVVACETRFRSSVTRAFGVHEPDASWVLTIDVESAESAPGRRFRFEIERETIDGGIRWSRFSGRESE
jgi:hypothetical protein